MYRSLLFVPGNQPKMLIKASAFRPDAFVPDMEDSVPMAEKGNARQVIQAHLKDLSDSGIPVIPRVNARDTGLTIDDLAAVVSAAIHGISIGKVGTAEDVRWLCDVIGELEGVNDLPVGSIKLIVWIETALGICNCLDICRASERIEAVAFGGEDFTHDMEIERLEDDSNVLYARHAICIAARAANVAALDTPYFQFRDESGLIDNARAARKIGFKGKFAIHPAQIDRLNEVFSPSPDEIAYAERVVNAFEEAERQGRGSTSLDGKVIDIPVVKRARLTLASQK